MTSGRQPVQKQTQRSRQSEHNESREGQRHSPELPTKSPETQPQPKDKRQSSSNKTQIPQERRLNDKNIPIYKIPVASSSQGSSAVFQHSL